MPGWFADFFRFAGALLYWNTRKTWFRLRRGRTACPCQSPSDSGRAYETRCDACVHWDRPDRFRRVCPLLVRTADGLRCSADTTDVRPFWRIVALYYGGALLAAYIAAVIAVFAFLRTIGYPVSIFQVGLPPLWHQVGAARGWFFLERSRHAFAAGRTNEGLLYLENSYDFDPSNYDAGFALAKTYQLEHPTHSDEIFQRLLRDHPERRDNTALQWFRALVARGDFEQTATLAASEVQRGTPRANAWMRALIFASRHGADAGPMRSLAASHDPAVVPWQQLLRTELVARRKDPKALQAALAAPWPADAPPYTLVYRTEMKVKGGDPLGAVDFLVAHQSRLDDETYWTLRLDCLASAGATQVLRAEFQAVLLEPPINQPRLKMMCAQLIRHPDRTLFDAVYAKVRREAMPFNDATAGGWFSILCAAGAVRDDARLHALTLELQQATRTRFNALLMVEAFFRGQTADHRAVSFLPFLPVPLEVAYALIDRYPGGVAPAAAPPAPLTQ